MMNILYLNHNVAGGGGTYYRAFHAARYLVRRGHKVTLFTISPRNRWGFERELREGVAIVQTPDLFWGTGRTGWDPWDALHRVCALWNGSWDIVHAWDCRPVVILPALRARQRSPLIIDWCDWFGRGGVQAERPGWLAKLYGPVETYFEEAFRTYAQATTVASRTLRERALKLGVPADSIMMLPGGSDTGTIFPQEKAPARKRLDIPSDVWVVGYMGALTCREAELLIDAVARARNSVPNLCLLGIGVRLAGSSRPFQELCGGKPWIRNIPRIPFCEVNTHLAACDALVLPLRASISNAARWPSKVNDYLASGRPIVATRVGELAALLDQGIGIGTQDTPEAVAEGIVQLASHPEFAEQLGRRGRALAEGDLNWSRLAEKLEDLYLRVSVGSSRVRVPARRPAQDANRELSKTPAAN